MRACHKRPIPMQDIQKLLDDVENEIFRRAETEIASAQIGELIMEHLKDLEEVAYVRFASVYREFTDVNTHLCRTALY